MLNPSTVRRAEGGYVISSQLVSADPRALPHPSTTLRALDTARPASWRAARTSTLAAVSLTTWTCAPRLRLGKQAAGALQVTRPGAGCQCTASKGVVLQHLAHCCSRRANLLQGVAGELAHALLHSRAQLVPHPVKSELWARGQLRNICTSVQSKSQKQELAQHKGLLGTSWPWL